MVAVDGKDVVYCGNWRDHGVCNWVRPRQGGHHLCVACQFNRTIPDLSLPNNHGIGALRAGEKTTVFFSANVGIAFAERLVRSKWRIAIRLP